MRSEGRKVRGAAIAILCLACMACGDMEGPANNTSLMIDDEAMNAVDTNATFTGGGPSYPEDVEMKADRPTPGEPAGGSGPEGASGQEPPPGASGSEPPPTDR